VDAQPKLARLANPKLQAQIDTVASILKSKGRQVWSIGPEATVYEGIAAMAERHVGALVVLAEGSLVGIVSERDYARKVFLRGKSSLQTRVREIMSTPVITVTPEKTVYECLRMMSAHRVRHLPVIEDGRLSGLVSIGDLVSSVLSMQAHTIDQLETYIASEYPQ